MTPIVWLCYVRRTWSNSIELPQCLEPTFDHTGTFSGHGKNKKDHEDCGWYKIERRQ